jgi:hypothetical protein
VGTALLIDGEICHTLVVFLLIGIGGNPYLGLEVELDNG